MLVLSYMHRAAQGGRHQARVRRTLQRKAQRAARLILPDLVLLSAGNRDVSVSRAAMTKAALSSPLLPKSRDTACSDLLAADGFEFEYLVLCLWLPLNKLASKTYASPLNAPKKVLVTQTKKSNYTILTFNGKDQEGSTSYRIDGVDGDQSSRLECNEDSDHLDSLHFATSASSFGRTSQRTMACKLGCCQGTEFILLTIIMWTESK